MTNKVLCLDWDRRSLRLVQARVARGRVNLEDAHAHAIPANVDCDDPAALGEFIASIVRRHHLRQKRVVVSVPRERAVINRLRLPPTPPAELAAAVRFQAMRELPFPLDEAEIDFVVLQRDPSGATSEVLLAAVRKETLERIRRTCVAAGLTPARIGLRPLANLESAIRLPGLGERRVLMIDVGPTQSEIDVLRAGQLAFSRTAPVSAPAPMEPLPPLSAKGEVAELENAEATRDAAVDELLVEITRSLQAYRATESNAIIDQILVAGGTGIEPALLAAVCAKFSLPGALYDPSPVLTVRAEDAVKLRSFSACLGLAWGISEGRLPLDFLHPKRPAPPRESLYRRLRVGGLAAATVAICLGAWAWSEQMSILRRTNELRKANNERAARAREVVRVDARATSARDWGDQAAQAIWIEHVLRLTRAGIEPGKKMIITDVTADAENARIILKVAADSWDTVTKYVDELKKLEDGGKPLYEVRPAAWRETRVSDAKFRGEVDLTIELPALALHVAGLKQRDIAAKKRIDEVR